MLVLNRFDDLPDFIQQIGVLAECTLTHCGARDAILAEALVPQLADDAPRVTLRNGVVAYNDKAVIDGLNWQVNPGEHWQIVGPNGAGKSMLLSLVTGDHPQGYSNNLTLFGIRRGSGETIWDIKQHIGYVSSSLHLDYRVSANVRTVILSGFFDSVGLYQAVSERQKALARLGMDNALADAPFHSLS
ncbi:molybdate ABC transporter ATP-binding protein ModF|nr:molybdate ABC transporter ATP-binding protein ModF [Candidatus Pantoea persica]